MLLIKNELKEEEAKIMNNLIDIDTPDAAAIGSYRDALPTHFTFKIQSFSLLTTTSMEKFECNDFEAGGYKWRIVFYPNGNPTENEHKFECNDFEAGGYKWRIVFYPNGNPTENEHISMYLKIVDTESLPRGGWSVDASFRFFVLDKVRDKYLILGDMGGRTRRFHEMKTMWGYSKLLPLTTLNDSSNRYIVNDDCLFGAEVFACKNTGCGDCLVMVQSPSSVKYTWKIENFSRIIKEKIYSNVFNAEEYKWKMEVFPKGESRSNKEYFSLYLWLQDGLRIADHTVGKLQVYAQYKLRVKDQLHNFDKELQFERWFIPPPGWGISKFTRLDELNDKSKGYLVNDTCIVEAEVTVLGALEKLS